MIENVRIISQLQVTTPTRSSTLVPSRQVMSSIQCRVVNRARAFRVGFGRARGWILKNCRASIGPDVREKSRFSVSDRVVV